MRRAYYDVGFMVQDDGTVVGISLGYDRCAEHEWGIRDIQSALGVNIPEVPIGIEDRRASRMPASLKFGRYTAKPRDKRRKGYPAAYLILDQGWSPVDIESNPAEALSRMDVQFVGQMTDKDHDPKWDCVCAWSSDSFVVNVRGEENIARLEELFNAFKACDISMAVPWARSFFRGGLAFVITSRVPEEEREVIRARDLAHKKLYDAAKATGIYETLEAAGKGFYALSPDWMDREVQEEVMFYLNPREQSKYEGGWFTLEELQAWAKDQGPILKHKEIEAFKKENRNASYNLSAALSAHGIAQRTHSVFTWADEAKTVIGARVLIAPKSESILPSGIYPLAELMERFPVPEEAAA